jgi:endonuclease/exonuclease/phosphatase family metal-dependent hydrolase
MRSQLVVKFLLLVPLSGLCGTATPDGAEPTRVRFATLNAAMGLRDAGELGRRLSAGNDPALRDLAEILQRVRPDVVLLNEIDYEEHFDAGALLQDNYLSRPRGDLEAIDYPHRYAAAVNTGVPSGLDLDGNGRPGDPADAWGFGWFPGQYGMLVLSRYPLDTDAIRSFRLFRWHDMPGALQPLNPDGSAFYPAHTWTQLRLSSKSHWDIPVRLGQNIIHLLASHPTPPVFDGPEDRNGLRNHDEIRLWADYVRPEAARYLRDDAGNAGGLRPGASFIIAGDQNADPHDGDSTRQAILQLLEHERINTRCVPRSEEAVNASRHQAGVNQEHRGDPGADTADFDDAGAGNLRIDYVLPSSDLVVHDCGVHWPAEGVPGRAATEFSDHRLVWLDITLNDVNR